MQVSYSVPNVDVYLELGILPTENKINKTYMTFLHHVVTLENEDPSTLENIATATTTTLWEKLCK